MTRPSFFGVGGGSSVGVGVGLSVLAEAEQAGLVEARPGGIGFRHELARRAIEQSLPELRRRLLNAEAPYAVLAPASSA